MNTKTLKVIIFSLFVLSSAPNLLAQAPYGNPGDHTPVPYGTSTAPFGYYEYLPLDFSNTSGETFPVVLFYHGWGERGNGTTELSNILSFGPPKLINQGTDFEAIFISPQNSDANYSASDFLSLYNYVISNYPVDINRFYVTGLSSGGGSTWRALQGHYDKIAAAVPICGSGYLNNPSDELQQTNIWAFHSFNDDVISVNNTITNVNRISDINDSVMNVYPYGSSGSAASEDYSMLYDTTTQNWTSQVGTVEPTEKLSFTLYNDGGHNSWTETYINQDVWDWLFAQSLGTLSTEEESIEELSVYPNPTNHKITVKSKDDSEKEIEIFDILGKSIYANHFSNKLTIDMSIYNSGIYMAKIIDANNNQRVVKIVVK